MVALRAVLYLVAFAFAALVLSVPLYFVGQTAWVFLLYFVMRLRQRGAYRWAARLAWLLFWASRIHYAIFGHLFLRRWLFTGHANVLSLRAGLLMDAGELAAADRLLDAALAEARKIRVSPWVHGQLLSNRAGLYLSSGAVAEARPLLERALAMQRAADRRRWDGGRLLDNLGLGRPTWAGTMLLHLGIVYQRIGDYPAAARCYLQARKVFLKQRHADRQPMEELLNNLGTLYLEVEDYPRAGRVLRYTAGYVRSWDGDRCAKYATVLLNLAMWYEKTGRYRQALRLIRKCLRIRTALLGTRHPAYFHALNNLACTLHMTGDYDAARPIADRALAGRAAYGEDHPLYRFTLFTRAAIDVADGRPGDALDRFREIIASERRLIGRIFSVASDAQRLAYLEKLRKQLYYFLSLVHTHLASAEAAAEAYDLVLARKALAAEASAARRDAVFSGRYPHLAGRLRELSALRQQIVARTLAGPGREGAAAHRRLLEAWQTRQAALELDLSRAIPELALEQRLLAADRRAVAAALPAGAALVEFVRFDLFDFLAVRSRGEKEWKPARYLAFVVRPEKPDAVRMIDLGEAEPIDRLIRQFRAELGDPAAGSRGMALLDDDLPAAPVAPDTGVKLRQRVFDPLAGAVAGASHLVLAPDGELAVVPFEVLAGRDGRPLIEGRRFSYLAVGRDLLRAQTGDGKPGASVVIAGPDFDLGSAAPAPRKRRRRAGPLRDLAQSAHRFPPLPGTVAEGREVAGRLGVKPLVGSAAVEGRLKRAVSPRVLHVATHGFFLADRQADNKRKVRAVVAGNPMLRSGLALAGANAWLAGGKPPAEAEDGLLTAEDVTGLDLLGTELVVLSACETGLGEVRAGEGVFGLRRAFQLAGAQTVVMSLWRVPDDPTRELMAGFYRRLLEGLPRAEALRQAQLELKTRYPDPRTWGAFICQGNPGPLPTP
jgi:CHAT domain-containing protein/tetratricopeptide (TPR) repeat protein